MASDSTIKERVQAAIERVFEMQDASGAFGVWGPRDGDMWLTSYVTDFLTRAKEAGYTVRPQAFAQALDRLQNYIGYAQDFESGGEARAYALYVLARNGRAPIGELRYYADTRLERFASAAGAGAARRGAGHARRRDRAEQALPRGTGADVRRRTTASAARDYGSGIRDGAALVTLASETGIAKVGDAAPGGRDRQGLRHAHLHLDAGAGVDAAGGARARPSRRNDTRSPSTARRTRAS